MKIAVIGANGFLGSHLSKSLLALHHQVYTVYNQDLTNIPDGGIILKMDDLFKVNIHFDIIYVSIGNFGNAHSEYLKQLSKLYLMVSDLHFEKVVFISSVAIYGNHSDIISIDASFNQPSLYGRSKLAQEFIIANCSMYSILRFTYLYGTGMGQNSIIPKWFNEATTKNEITVFGDGLREQDYLHISDAVELCIKSGLDNRNMYLLGATGNAISNFELASLISKEFSNCEIKFVPGESGPSFRYDIQRTIDILDWTPKVQIAQGINSLYK